MTATGDMYLAKGRDVLSLYIYYINRASEWVEEGWLVNLHCNGKTMYGASSLNFNLNLHRRMMRVLHVRVKHESAIKKGV